MSIGLRGMGGKLRLMGVAALAMTAGVALGGAAQQPRGAAAAAPAPGLGGAVKSTKLSFKADSPFLIVIQRNDGKNWINVNSATCKYTQTGMAPIDWQWHAGDVSIHQNPKFATIRFTAKRAGSAMTLVSGSLLITVNDTVNGPVDTTGSNINVDEVTLDPCPPMAVAPAVPLPAPSGPEQAR